jgi:hypothetical protein
MIIKDYEWEEGTLGGNFLYYNTDTGEIIGEVSRVGMQGSRSSASSYYNRKVTVYLGNYINSDYARRAVENYTFQQSGIFIEYDTQKAE